MAQIFPRGVAIPTALRTATIRFAGNGKGIATVRVFEGESPSTKDNIFLGALNFKILTATSEKPIVEVRFFISPNGMVFVSGPGNAMVIKNASTRIFNQEIEDRISTAALHADADDESRARMGTNVDDNGEGEGQSITSSTPEDQTNNDDENTIDEWQWGLKTWPNFSNQRLHEMERR